MQALAPVKANEREIFMDVLRGFAILGIFIANLNGFSWYREIPAPKQALTCYQRQTGLCHSFIICS